MWFDKSFRCKICSDEVDSLYFVRLARWRKNPSSETVSKHLNSLPSDQWNSYVKAIQNQHDLRLSFICRTCLDKFADLDWDSDEMNVVDFSGVKWRLGDSDWSKLLMDQYPVVYDCERWQKYQKRKLQRMLRQAP